MKTFELSPAYCKKLLYQRALASCGMMTVVGVVIVLVTAYQSGGDVTPFLTALPLLAVVSAFGIVSGLRRLSRTLASYRLMLDGEELLRTQEGLPEVVLLQDEVTAVVETPGVGLVIQTSDPQRVIVVPAGLEGYDELRGLLGNLAEVRVLPSSTVRRQRIFTGVLVAAVAGAFVVPPLVHNRWVAAGCYLVGIVVLVWSFVLLQRNPTIDRRTKLLSWMIVFPLFALVAGLVLALAGRLEG